MDVHQAIITIGREYGSGGHEIGKLLAERLGMPYYDKEILTLAARESGICEKLFENHDEKTSPSYLFSLVAGSEMLSPASSVGELPLNHRIFMAQFDAITRVATQGPCVVVGRCANYVLRDQPRMASVFMYGNLNDRIHRIMQVENLPFDQAKERVHKMDKQRQSYYNFFAEGNWGHRSNYHIMLNTSGVTPSAVVDSIIAYLTGR